VRIEILESAVEDLTAVSSTQPPQAPVVPPAVAQAAVPARSTLPPAHDVLPRFNSLPAVQRLNG